MIPELGLFFLTAAAAAALVTAVFCFYGVAKGNVFARDFWRAGLTSAVRLLLSISLPPSGAVTKGRFCCGLT